MRPAPVAREHVVEEVTVPEVPASERSAGPDERAAVAGSPTFTVSATVLGTPDPKGLADFWARLLGWETTWSAPEWVMLKPPGGGAGLSFQLEEGHTPPAWPAGPGDQQMQLHLDVRVDDLGTGVEKAVALGASLAPFQPQDDVRVMLDPAGHPFCLFEN